MESKNSRGKDDKNQWFSINERGIEKEIEISVIVELFRFIFYCWFFAIILVGMSLTYGVTAKENKTFYEVIEAVFGSVNVCAYFDFPPSTYVLPAMYGIEIMFIYQYSILSIFRAWIAKLENKITGVALWLYSCTFLYFCISACIFSIIFAVPPNPRDPKTVLIHTLPFTNHIISLTFMQIAVTWFGKNVSSKEICHHYKFTHKLVKRASLILLFGLIITSTLKVLHHINALGEAWNLAAEFDEEVEVDVEELKLHYRGMWFNVHNYKILLQMVDKLWLISAFVGPMIQSGYITFKAFRTHLLIFTIKDNRSANPQLAGNVVGQQGHDA